MLATLATTESRAWMFDLFGEIIVTDDDIFDWVASVSPRWMYSKRAFENYVRSYDVAEKVRNAKRNGTFENT